QTSNENNFGKNLNFDNFENSTATSEDFNNEQDMTNNTKLEKSHFAKENLKWNPNWKTTYPWVDLVHNIATLNFEDLCLLIELQIQNSNENIILGGANLLNSPKPTTTMKSTHSEYGSYINDHTARQFISAIARIIEEATLNELRTSKAWSLMIDEIFHYLGIIKLQSASSNAILNDLEQFILAKHLPHETLYHFGSDGASVNL
ncbi:6645_t:CDS:2, partial [Racocetra persica]